MISAQMLSRASHPLRHLTVRRNAGTPTLRLVFAQSRTPAIRFFATQTNSSDEQKKFTEGNQSSSEHPKFEEPEIPGSRVNVKPHRSRGISPFITGLLVAGFGFTAYGLYEIYAVMNMWPPEIRTDLRSGLLAKRRGDLDIAAQYLHRAWERTKTLPVDVFGSEPLLKTTGIGISLGGILEQDQKLEQAYKIYEDVFWNLRTAYLDLPPSTIHTRPDLGVETLKTLSSTDKMRAVALAYKLGELAHILHKPKKEEERWLVWAVEAVLRTVLDAPPMAAVEVVRTVGTGGGIGAGAPGGPNIKVLVEQLGLPLWSVRHDIAAPFEALATFYAKEGNITYALPLYLQAISILIPPAPNVSPVEDKCRGAQLMGNVAELLVRNLNRNNASPEAISQAESWAKKGLEVVMAARKVSPIEHDVCEEAFAVLLYNVAMVRELSGDTARARALLSESLAQSKVIGMQDGIEHAENAIRELDSGANQIKPLVVDTENSKAL